MKSSESRAAVFLSGMEYGTAEPKKSIRKRAPKNATAPTPTPASARVALFDLLLLALSVMAWQAYRQIESIGSSVKSFSGASLCFRCLFFAISGHRIGFERMEKTA